MSMTSLQVAAEYIDIHSGDQLIDGPGHLKVPRDELRHAFVLGPLAEIAGDVVVPGSLESIARLWQQHPGHDGIWKKVDLS